MTGLTPAAAAVVAAMEDAFPRLEDLPAAEGRALAAALPRPPLPPIEVGSVDDRVVPSPVRDVPVRLYRPVDDGAGPPAVVVYFHGGGFVIGDLDTYDRGCRALCAGTG